MIKKLAQSIREYKRDSILTPIFVTFEVIMEVIIPYLMADLIDKGIDAGNMNYILKMGIALAISCVVSLVFGALLNQQFALGIDEPYVYGQVVLLRAQVQLAAGRERRAVLAVRGQLVRGTSCNLIAPLTPVNVVYVP